MSPVSELPSTSSSSCDAGQQESQFGSSSYDYEGTNGRTKAQEEAALLEKLNLLLDEARTFPVHSIITRIVSALESVSGDFYEISEPISPVSADEVFTKLKKIISLISPVEMSDFHDSQFDHKIDTLKFHVDAWSAELDDDISLSTSGKNPEFRLKDLMDRISKFSVNANMAAIIRGDESDPLWSPLVRVPYLEDLLPEDEEQCFICTSVTINEHVNFAILSGCLHLLCENCAWTWFDANATCPLCHQDCLSFTTRDRFVEFKREQRRLETRYSKGRSSQHRQLLKRPKPRFSPY